MFNDGILCCSAARLSICNCICCKLSWCLFCSMGVKYGVCTARVLLLLIMPALTCSACMITTLERFVICCHPLLVRCCWQSWVCCLCKCFGSGRPCSFGTAWPHCLRAPFTTLSVWTILLMPLAGVLAIWLALWRVAYIQWVMTCAACVM